MPDRIDHAADKYLSSTYSDITVAITKSFK